MIPGESHSFSALIQDNRKEFTTLLVLGVLLGYAFYFFQTRSSDEGSEVEEHGVLQMENIVVNDYVETLKGWQLKGEQAVVLEESRRMRIEKVRIWIYVPYTIDDAQPVVEVYITADQGLVEWKDSRVTLSGNVVMNRRDGSTIFSETAVYDSSLKSLTLPKPVRILNTGHTLEGTSLTLEIKQEMLKLTEPVLIRH